MPCVGKGHMQNATFIEVAQHKAGSWPSACLESLTETTAFYIVTGRWKLRLPWPKAMSLNESRLLCLKQWRVWLKTMQPT